MSTFSIKPTVCFDEGSVEYLNNMKEQNEGLIICCDAGSIDYLNNLAGKKAFIVTDPFMVKSGAVNKITDIFKRINVDYEIFAEIVPDPPVDIVADGVGRMMAFRPDALIALGGGSSIDATKAIMAFCLKILKNKGDTSGYKKPLFIAVPTTSGTGSEVTSFSIITTGVKKVALIDQALIPDVAILDADFVKTVPSRITADTAIDVITHGVEAYVSNNASDFADAFAEKAIKTVFQYLPKAYANGGDMEAREKLHNASCMAGMAFTNAGLGINHSLAHILGATFHVPHGRANAIVMPYVIKYNANLESGAETTAAKRYREIAEFLGLPASTVKEGVTSLINAVNALKKETNTPMNISETGISREDFMAKVDSMGEIALADRCTPTNPRVPTKEDLVVVFKEAYGDLGVTSSSAPAEPEDNEDVQSIIKSIMSKLNL
ncbi:1-propanol dehydrogenase PduQ [Clostridium kluyveri]|uniref:1-propanol dehydrogenase PduQ n=1 Tax=Clostridium kluyveri TaxID=1534 RepID=UPI002247A1A3|nr:1-propanol dehydrogenase PduQ [Clostridium kluyveri]UZQ50738.1 iron-containing alcohol dehydrogenase [Clostridium kluyveri]